jgi:hypothetical protein
MNDTDTLSSSFRTCSLQLLTSLFEMRDRSDMFEYCIHFSALLFTCRETCVATVYSSYSHNHALLRTELTNSPISVTFGIYSVYILQTRETIPFFTDFSLQGLQSSFQVRSLKLLLISSSASVIERDKFL